MRNCASEFPLAARCSKSSKVASNANPAIGERMHSASIELRRQRKGVCIEPPRATNIECAQTNRQRCRRSAIAMGAVRRIEPTKYPRKVQWLRFIPPSYCQFARAAGFFLVEFGGHCSFVGTMQPNDLGSSTNSLASRIHLQAKVGRFRFAGIGIRG